MSFVGSPYWMAPETNRGKHVYNSLCDIWSLRITITEMVESNPALLELEQMEACQKIIDPAYADEITLHDDKPSPALQLFVDTLLAADPSSRPDASELCKEPYIVTTVKDLRLLQKHKYFDSDLDGAANVVGFGRRKGGAQNLANAANRSVGPMRSLIAKHIDTLEEYRKKKKQKRAWVKRKQGL